jgi:hypothetical protein
MKAGAAALALLGLSGLSQGAPERVTAVSLVRVTW